MMADDENIECVTSGHGALAPHRRFNRWRWHRSNLSGYSSILELAQALVLLLLGQQLLKAERGQRDAEERQHGGRAGHHTVGRRRAGGEAMAAVRRGLCGQRRRLREIR